MLLLHYLESFKVPVVIQAHGRLLGYRGNELTRDVRLDNRNISWLFPLTNSFEISWNNSRSLEYYNVARIDCRCQRDEIKSRFLSSFFFFIQVKITYNSVRPLSWIVSNRPHALSCMNFIDFFKFFYLFIQVIITYNTVRILLNLKAICVWK